MFLCFVMSECVGDVCAVEAAIGLVAWCDVVTSSRVGFVLLWYFAIVFFISSCSFSSCAMRFFESACLYARCTFSDLSMFSQRSSVGMITSPVSEPSV